MLGKVVLGGYLVPMAPAKDPGSQNERRRLRRSLLECLKWQFRMELRMKYIIETGSKTIIQFGLRKQRKYSAGFLKKKKWRL